MQFKILEHTADIGIEVYGKGLPQLFQSAAVGMFSLMVESKGVSEKKRLHIELNSEDREGLLVAWLNELLYYFNVKKVIPVTYRIRIEDSSLSAWIKGIEFQISKARPKLEVKAATYHQLEVIPPAKDSPLWKARIIFDV